MATMSLSRRHLLTAIGVGGALAAGGSLTACGGSGGDKDFVVYSADATFKQNWQKMLQKRFGDPNGLTVKIFAYQPADFLTQFQNAVRSNAPVDGLVLNGQNVGFLQSKGLLKPVDDLIDPGAFQPAAMDPFRIKGKYYAAGIGTLNTSMLAYNKDLLTKHDLTVPETFDDLKANVRKLKGTGVALLGFGGATVFQWPMWFMAMLQQTSGGQPIELTKKTLAGGPSFTSGAYVHAMELLQELGASGAFAPGLMGTSFTAAQADFVAGKSAMYWYGSWIISQLVDQAKFPVEIAPFPRFVSGVAPDPVGSVTAATGLYTRTASDRQDLARKFVRFLTSPQGDQYVMQASPQGFPAPAVKSVQVPKQTALDKQVATEFVPKTFTFLDWLWPAAVTTAFQQNIQAVIGQKKSPKAAMADIQKTFESGS